jgi:hypothetical protein
MLIHLSTVGKRGAEGCVFSVLDVQKDACTLV